jgi:hypothetical protein
VFVVAVYSIVVVWAPALKQTAAAIPVVVMVGKPFTLVTLTEIVLNANKSPSPERYKLQVTVYVIAEAETTGVTLAVCAVVKADADDGAMAPPLFTDHEQSKETILSVGVIVVVNAVPEQIVPIDVGKAVIVNLGNPPAALNSAKEKAALLLVVFETAIVVVPIVRLLEALPPVG